ncbi:hypothetical protein GOV09_03030 [Candidatus Woesearchaeota archaeon]|nr:hypothetical protein [Candidatus Woesearchaeota archaeon]
MGLLPGRKKQVKQGFTLFNRYRILGINKAVSYSPDQKEYDLRLESFSAPPDTGRIALRELSERDITSRFGDSSAIEVLGKEIELVMVSYPGIEEIAEKAGFDGGMYQMEGFRQAKVTYPSPTQFTEVKFEPKGESSPSQNQITMYFDGPRHEEIETYTQSPDSSNPFALAEINVLGANRYRARVDEVRNAKGVIVIRVGDVEAQTTLPVQTLNQLGISEAGTQFDWWSSDGKIWDTGGNKISRINRTN